MSDIMEKIVYGNDSLEIPSGLSDDFSYLLDIISPETWNNVLNDDHRTTLLKFLPSFPENNLAERTRTLQMLFMNENFHFGTPLGQFFQSAKNCHFNPNISKLRKFNKKLSHKSYRQEQKAYFHNLLEEILVKRKNIFDKIQNPDLEDEESTKLMPKQSNTASKDLCLHRARKRYFKELKNVKNEADCASDLSEDDEQWDFFEKSDVVLNKKQRRQVALLETSFPSDLTLVRSTYTKGSLTLDLEAELSSVRNPFDSSEEQYRNLLSFHVEKQRKATCPSLDTNGLTLKSILARCESTSKKPFPRYNTVSCTPTSSQNHQFPNTAKKSLSKKKSLSSATQSEGGIVPKKSSLFSVSSNHSRDSVLLDNHIKKEVLSDSSSEGEPVFNNTLVLDKEPLIPSCDIKKEEMPTLTPELCQETHSSFFSLLRDIICSAVDHRMTQNLLMLSISRWQHSAISPLNVWFCFCSSWIEALPSAINFLCGNAASDIVPADFVPFIEYKGTIKYFQWIGAGRDFDNNLEPLCKHWLSVRDNLSNFWPIGELSTKCEPPQQERLLHLPLPGKAQKSTETRPIFGLKEKHDSTEYHKQERMRYNLPYKAFTFKLNDTESIIGPVKGVYNLQSGSTTKARGHLLLTPDRPPYVTILSLVWDAVARLPNSEGTKLDICELVKDSQFLVPIVSQSLENSLNGVVSGALDRLQNENDPCVRFDTSRKVWVYLHKDRTKEELELMHQLKSRTGFGGNRQKISQSKKVTKKKDEVPSIQRSPNLDLSRRSPTTKVELIQGPPNVALEQFAHSIKQMDGSAVKIKEEDLLKDIDKLSPNKNRKKLKTEKLNNINLSSVDTLKLSLGTQTNSIAITQNNQHLEKTELKAESLSPGLQIRSTHHQLPDNVAYLPRSSEAAAVPALSTLQTRTVKKYVASDKRKRKAPEVSNVPSSTAPMSTLKIISTTSSSCSMGNNVLTPGKAIKLLQYSNASLEGKAVSGTPLVVDGVSSIPATIVGQKLVLSGNKVLLQSGKFLQNTSPASSSNTGKQVLASVVPTQIMSLNNVKSHSTEQQNSEGGRFVQIATIDPQTGLQKQQSYQKLTLVPQLNPNALASNAQKLKTAQAIGSIQKTSMAPGDFKLKLASSPAYATASGNIINFGGKQILLATKAFSGNRTGHIQQVVLGDSRLRVVATKAGATSSVVTLPLTATATSSTTVQQPSSSTTSVGQQVVLPSVLASSLSPHHRLNVAGISNTQQIVLPASALAGSQINLKRLQTLQSFKVVPASQILQQPKGAAVMSHIVTPSTISSNSNLTPTVTSQQILAKTQIQSDKNS